MAKSDKTEKATPKKKRDTRKKGQIAKSQDLTAWFSLLVALYIPRAFNHFQRTGTLEQCNVILS